MPIDATNGFSLVVDLIAEQRPRRHAAADRGQPLGVRLFFEPHDLPVAIEQEDAHRRRIVRRHRQRGDRDVGVLVDMRVEQPPVVHAIEMIAGENQVVVGVVPPEVPRRLPHRVGRALKPARAVRRLLGRDDVDEPVRERIHAIGLRDVMVERRRVELRQHEDAPQVGVQAVADRHVDQAVLAADRHRRLRALLRERKEARSLAAAEDDREHVVHVSP